MGDQQVTHFNIYYLHIRLIIVILYIKKARAVWELLENILILPNLNEGSTTLTLLCMGDQQVTHF